MRYKRHFVFHPSQERSPGSDNSCDVHSADRLSSATNISPEPCAVPELAALCRSSAGVGAAAVFYTDANGYSVLAAGKQSYGQTRTVIFSAPAVVPEQKLIDVERLVIDRI
jgi:hypothetical protein